MTLEEYQIQVIDLLNNIYTIIGVLCIIIGAFFVYMVFHNTMGKK